LRVADCCYEHADRNFGSLTEAPRAEQLLGRVAAIEVAKASAVVCVRVGHASIAGRRGDESVGGALDDPATLSP
jgi:hypothetical protein